MEQEQLPIPNPEEGLTSEEAKKRLAQFGANKLQEGKKKSFFVRFLLQFKDVMILILLGAAILSFVLSLLDGKLEWLEVLEPVLILAVVVANAFMGVLQESKAEKALEALKNMTAPSARVIRDGSVQLVPASELVVGDILKLEAGDYVPADAKLLESTGLKCEESALTGESVAVEKDAKAEVAEDAPLAERHNAVFSGTFVTYGTATAVVTHTGMATQMGKIAGLIVGEKEMLDNTVSVRSRKEGDMGAIPLESFIAKALVEINTKAR
jgi:Ca2+-transporting ATPase